MNSLTDRILIIDSVPEWRNFAKSVLIEAGYMVEEIASAKDVNHFLVGEAFDLILMNLIEAEKESHILQKLAKPIHNRPGRVVVIFPTQLSLSEAIIVLKLGAYDCRDKPFDKDGLIKLVKEELADARMRKKTRLAQGEKPK